MSINANNTALNEILSMINNLPSVDGSGGGMVYTNIVYNDDNTVTLTDKDGVDHIMVCEYTDGVLSGLTYDEKSVELTYEEDILVNIGTIEVDMANMPIESGGGTEEIEQIIDQSGVLDRTDGSVTDKVALLINIAQLFGSADRVECTNESIPERIDFYIDNNLRSAADMFRNCVKLKFVVGVNTSLCVQVANMFSGSGVEEIQEPFDFSSSTNSRNAFTCSYLREVRFVPETIYYSTDIISGVLSNESIQSTIDGLAYVTTSQNLKLHKDIVLTDNQKQVINAKGWTLIQ
jgi:hypothetical protein